MVMQFQKSKGEIMKKMETEFSKGFNHCIAKAAATKGGCEECVKADVCCVKNEREELMLKVSSISSKFTIDIQCPHFYKAQIQLR